MFFSTDFDVDHYDARPITFYREAPLEDTFRTSTHRCAPADINLATPLMHLLRLISISPKLTPPTTAYFRLVDGILEAT